MTAPALVVPADDRLLGRLAGRTVILQLAEPARLSAAVATARRHEVRVECVALTVDTAITALELPAAWRGVPVAVHAPRLGLLRHFLGQLEALRRLELCLFLPADEAETCRSLRIAASLGLATGVDFRAGAVDWEALADLAAWALLSPVRHGPVRPFTDLARRYRPRERVDFGFVYFDGPSRYLHVDAAGRVALTAADLAAGRVLADAVEALEPLERYPAYVERAEAWRQVFLDANPCSSCPGWRLCLGRLAALEAGRDGCRDFAVELLDLVERYHARRERDAERWRP